MSVISDFEAEKRLRVPGGRLGLARDTATMPAGFDIVETVTTIWREKWRVALVLLAVLAASAVYLFVLATPKYSATSVLMLETREETVVDLESVMSGLSVDLATINTEIEVMRSRHLMGRVVEELALELDPEFNPTLRPDRLAPLRGLMPSLWPAADRAAKDATPVRQKAIDLLLEAVSVSSVRQSYVFRITALTDSSQKSALIANKLAELYIVDQVEAKAAANEDATGWLREQVQVLGQRLEDSEAAVESYLAATPLVGEQALTALKRQVKDLRVRHNEALNSGNDAQARALATSIAALEADVQAQSQDLLHLRQLQRKAEAMAQIHQHFLARLNEIAVQKGIQSPDARIISEAVRAINAASPKLLQSLIFAALAGVFLGCVFVLSFERFRQGFATVDALEAGTGLPVLGTIPLAPVRRREKILPYVQQKPTSAVAEAVRNLRTSLLLSDAGNPPQVVLLTSSVSSEGKSSLAIMLAQNAATMGKNVLIIEADLRRQTFQRFLGIEGSPGLGDILHHGLASEAAIVRPADAGFDVLPGGTTTANPADLFSSPAFAATMASLRGRYEFIVVDAPPVLPVPDARILAQSVDAVLYSVQWRRTTKIQVKLGLDMLRSLDVRLAGLVMTQVEEAKMAQYYGYGGYGAYKAGQSYQAN